jgi:hypothetical protein
MKAFILVWSLIRIPRLFISLLLFPLLLSIFVVYAQIFFTGVAVKTSTIGNGVTSNDDQSSLDGSSEQDPKASKDKRETNMLRRYLLGIENKLEDVKVCYWNDTIPSGTVIEGPPKHHSPDCTLERFDVVLKVKDPSKLDIEPYIKVFKGHLKKIHVCNMCFTDIILDKTGTTDFAYTSSMWALMFLNFTKFSEENLNLRKLVSNNTKNTDKVIGEKYLQIRGFAKPTKIKDLSYTVIIICNIAVIVIVSLWLSIKAHRKVLDYFSSNGALLPLVASTGKSNFYLAIWSLTLIRVGFFLLAVIPASYFSLNRLFSSKELKGQTFLGLLFNHNALEFLLWLFALFISFCLSTLIASIADLKHRHALLSFIYKYIPLFICLFGGILWGISFMIDNALSENIRTIISSMPLLGIPAILLAPIFTPAQGVLVVNILLTFTLFMMTLLSNIRWFAAHLEEL